MKTELSNSTPLSVKPGLASNHLLSVAQQVLTDLGWEDLRPAIYAAEQVDHEIAEELQAAHAAYVEEAEEPQQRRLQTALDKTIHELQTDYKRVRGLKAQAEKRLSESSQAPLSSSYSSLLRGWMFSGLQQVFSSDDASLVTRYSEIAQNRQKSIRALRGYRDSLAEAELQSRLKLEEVRNKPYLPCVELLETVSPERGRSHVQQLLTVNVDPFLIYESSDNNKDSSVATFSDNGFVVSWRSDSNVYAQQFRSNGSPSKDEFKVTNLKIAGGPSVATMNDSYVITWHSNSSGSSYDVYAKVYSSDGSILKNDFRVNTHDGTSDQMYPSVGIFGDMGFVIAWQNNGFNLITTQRYNSDYSLNGSPQFLGTSDDGRTRNQTSVGAFADGSYVVVYNRNANNIYGQCFKPNGLPVFTQSFQVGTDSGSYSNPSVGVFTDGSFVVAWQYEGNGDDIHARVYTKDCTPAGNAWSVNIQEGDQTNPSVDTFSNDANFIIAWADGSTSPADAQVQLFNKNSPLALLKHNLLEDNIFFDENDGSLRQAFPHVGTFSDGGYVAVYDASYLNANRIYVSLSSGLPMSVPTTTPVLITTLAPTTTPVLTTTLAPTTTPVLTTTLAPTTTPVLITTLAPTTTPAPIITPTPTPAPNTSAASSNSEGIIAGGIAGGVGGLAVMLTIGLCIARRKRRQLAKIVAQTNRLDPPPMAGSTVVGVVPSVLTDDHKKFGGDTSQIPDEASTEFKEVSSQVHIHSSQSVASRSVTHLEPPRSEEARMLIKPRSPSPRKLIDDTGELKISVKIPFADLKMDYQAKLGEGAYGAVYQADYQYSIVAVKELHAKRLSTAALRELRNEAGIMASMRSDYLVQFRGVCLEAPHFCLVMELMPKGSLYGLLRNHTTLPLTMKYQIALDVSYGLCQLHDAKIIHRDLKSLNVLLDDRLRAKITDFGLARFKSELNEMSETKSSRGTLGWMAPELLNDPPPPATQAMDIYAFGMILWELITNPARTPFQGLTLQLLMIQKISRKMNQETIPKDCPSVYAELIRSCWQAPKGRPAAKDLAKSLGELFKATSASGAQGPGKGKIPRPSPVVELQSVLPSFLAS